MSVVDYLNKVAQENGSESRFADVSSLMNPAIDAGRVCVGRYIGTELQDALEVDRWAIGFIYDSFKGYTKRGRA